MSYIDFEVCQIELSKFLQKKLLGEPMNESLCKRAQRLVDKWFKDLKKPVIINRADLHITGCTLAFTLGSIKVSRWHTQFIRDQFNLRKTVPSAIALGYVNNNQLYIADVEDVPTLCARDTPFNVERWSVSYGLTPSANSELFVALERAKALGYLDHLKGE